MPDLIRPSTAQSEARPALDTADPRSLSRRFGRRALIGVVVLALALGGISLWNGRRADPTGADIQASPGWSASTTPVPDGIGHIHALVRNPRTGQTLAATHNGLVELTRTGSATLVGAARDDLMGLAADANGTLWASGHPAAATSTATSLGLIRSTDGGVTWVDVSRRDVTDFHALTVRGSTVIGASGDSLLTSVDGGITWAAGARTAVGTLTLDTSALWVTTPEGLQRSNDNGRTLIPVQDAPALVMGALAPDKTVWGSTRSGAIMRWLGDRWDTVATVKPGEQIESILGISASEVLVTTPTRLIWIAAES